MVKQTVLLARMNWRTTALGIGVLFTALGTAMQAALDGDPSTTVNFGHLMAEVQIAIALIFARDGNT